MKSLFRPHSPQAGFALIVAVSMMAFIMLIIVSLTTVVSLELSVSSTSTAERKAKENARLGMIVALGQLQKVAGPDRRVTAPAEIFEPGSDGGTTGVNILSPQWTGAWTTTGTWDDESTLENEDVKDFINDWRGASNRNKVDIARWLVSGNSHLDPGDPDYITPETDLSALPHGQVAIVKDTSTTPSTEISVAKEQIPGGSSGHFAYWIADENTKARVDLVDDFVANSEGGTSEEKHFGLTKSFQVSQRSGLEFLDKMDDYPANSTEVQRLLDVSSTVSLSKNLSSDEATKVEDQYFSSLTPWSKGLLVDVKNGGLKRDLTQAFEYRKIFDQNFVLKLDNDDDTREPLYFIDDPVMTANGLDRIDVNTSGPNWHILRSYYRQYIPGTKSAKFSWQKSNEESIAGENALIREKIDLEDYTDLVKNGPSYSAPFIEDANASPSSTDQKLNKYLGWKHSAIEHSFSPASATGKPYQTIPDAAEYFQGEPLKIQADNYQLQSWLTPIVARVQISFGLSQGKHGLELIVKPILGLYNPYNTEIEFDRLKFNWGINPTIIITVDGELPVEFGLREIMPIDGAGSLSFFVKDRGTSGFGKVRLRPGETRFYGIDPSGIPEYPSDRIASNGKGLYAFWKNSAGATIGSASGDGPVRRNFLTNYNGSPGGLIIPFQLSVDAYRPEKNKGNLSEGPTEIKWFQSQVKGSSDPRKKSTWGLIPSERERLGALVDPTNTESKGFDFSVSLSDDKGVSLNTGFSFADNIQSIGKIFADFPNNNQGLFESVYIDNLNTAILQDEIITLGYWLKMPKGQEDPWRTLVDSNIRAINANSEWDGFDQTKGYRVMSTFATESPGLNRGQLSETAATIQLNDFGRVNGYWGDEIISGSENIVLFDRPRTALLSLGGLQHANMGRYNFDPTYMVANSYANVRIPLSGTSSESHSTYTYSNETGDPIPDDNPYPFKLFDTSYLVNEKLWDRYFFSGITKEATEEELDDYKDGKSAFGNQRYSYSGRGGEMTFTDLEDRENEDTLFHSIAANIEVEGAFNVNSTSVDAWKAFLGGLSQDTLPVYDYDKGYTTENGGIVSSRFTWPYHGKVNLDSGSGDDNFWKGVREISSDELDDLAQAMVDQVKLRGPFLSFADFVNRSLANDITGKSGALQAALDDPRRGVNTNSKLSSVSDSGPTTINGAGFNDVFPDTNMQAAGFPGYVLQGDILQRLAPVMTVRGDTFLIRSYGDYTDPLTGKVIGEAWCEAVVQRTIIPVDTDYVKHPYELINPTNLQGRQFEVLSFRWLNENEI